MVTKTDPKRLGDGEERAQLVLRAPFRPSTYQKERVALATHFAAFARFCLGRALVTAMLHAKRTSIVISPAERPQGTRFALFGLTRQAARRLDSGSGGGED
jgi:hypothetical protein